MRIRRRGEARIGNRVTVDACRGNAIPRTSSGKLRRKLLARMFIDGELAHLNWPRDGKTQPTLFCCEARAGLSGPSRTNEPPQPTPQSGVK